MAKEGHWNQALDTESQCPVGSHANSAPRSLELQCASSRSATVFTINVVLAFCRLCEVGFDRSKVDGNRK